MDIRFEDDELRRMYEDDGFRPRRLHRDIVRAYRKAIGWIAAAESELDLYGLKSLHFEKLKGDRVGQHSLRLNDQFRLIVRIEARAGNVVVVKVVVVIEIVDYH